MNKRLWMSYGICLLVAGLSPAGETNPDAASSRWDPGHLTLGARGGDVQEYVADVLVPAWKPGQAMLFLNLRGSTVENDAQEVNAGLVARHLWSKPALIAGVNVFYDLRATEHDNTFGQIGAGVELLSKWIDLRANYYYPVTDEKILAQTEDVVTESSGRARTTTTTRYHSYEEPLQGYDAEAGLWLPGLDRFAPTAVFGGYYHFASDFRPDYSGFKARIESRLHPNLTFDAEWYEDDELNRTDFFVGFRVNPPFDFWNGMRFDRHEGGKVRPFESRMGDMVYRDFRIRTIETGPVAAFRTETVDNLLSPRIQPPAQAPPPPRPNCFLNEEGEVVCF